MNLSIKKKGFPFDESSEHLTKEIKENILNKLLFLKDNLDEKILNDFLNDLTKKAFSKFYGLKPEIISHTMIM